jgi:hypothetical protein
MVKSLCFFFNWAPRHEGVAARILDLETTLPPRKEPLVSIE